MQHFGCVAKKKSANYTLMTNPFRVHALAKARSRSLNIALLCLLWSVVFALLAAVVPLVPLELAENALQDAVVRHGLKTAAPDDLVLLALDESSLDLTQLDPAEIAASPALRLMAQPFPWSRAVYADVIERVLGAGAKVVVLDIHFPAGGVGDDILRDALAKHARRTVIASLYEDREGEHTMGSQFLPPSPTVLPEGSGGSLSGFANFWPEADHVVRGAHYFVSDALLLGDLDLARPQGRGRKSGHAGEKKSSLAAVALGKAGWSVGLPPSGLIRFCEPGSFPVVPLYSIFVPEMWEANLQKGVVFRDKIVLLGPQASRFHDMFRTPVGTLPGPEIHLHAIAAAAAGAFYTRAGAPTVAATCLLGGLVAWLISIVVHRPLAALAALGMALVGYALLALLLYNYADFIPGLLYPGASLALAGLTAFAYDFSLERRERARVRRSLERYVSRDVVRELLDHGSELLSQLGGTRKDVAVLFSDVRGFTALSEHADPEVLVRQLNEYLGEMVHIVFHHSGTLDKFIGDAIMAVWGTVTTDGPRGDCLRAVRAALSMLEAVETMRRKWRAEARPELRLGIGINFGHAIFGNIGSEEKMEPTVIGDAVNLASRLEGVTKKYGLSLVLSGSVAEKVRGEFPLRTVDVVRVSGRKAPVALFTIPLDADGRVAAPDWLARHEEGWGHYFAARFAEAVECFESTAAAEGGAGAAMLVRCRELLAHPPGPEWEPIVTLESK